MDFNSIQEELEGPRGTLPEEYEKTLALAQSIFQGADLARDFSLEWHPENRENLRIILVNGEPRAHVGFSQREACILGNRVTLGLIGGVCCHPDFRNRGFAGACLQDAIAQLTRRGVSLMPVSGRRTLYSRHHCACAGVSYQARIARAQLPAAGPQGLEVRPYVPAILDDLIRLYQQEPIRYLRSREVMATLMERGPTEVVWGGGRPVAYAKAQGPEEAPDGSRRLVLYELTGPRELLVGALPALAERDQLDQIVLAPLYGTDRAVRGALSRWGIPVERSEALAGTVRVVNFPLLLEQMAPYFRERLGQVFERLIYYEQDGKFVFGLGGQRFELQDRTDLALFLLGPQQSRQAVSPPEGPLGEVLQEVFPMPYVFPGNDNV